MKKIILLSMFVLGLTTINFAQTIQFSDYNGVITNGSTVDYRQPDSTVKIEVKPVTIKNTGSKTLNIWLKQQTINVVAGSENTFCDWNVCYNAADYLISMAALVLIPNQSVTNIALDYDAHGNGGSSFVKYTVIDSTSGVPGTILFSYTAKYSTGIATGINTPNNDYSIGNAYPNPAKTSFNVNYNFDKVTSATIELLNVLGTVVKTVQINKSVGTANIDVSDLSNGVYFYNVIVGNKKVASKKLMVQH